DLGLGLALLAHLLLSAAQSLHWAVGMALALVLRRRLKAPLPLAFAAGVMLALSIPSVFVWSPAGLLSPWPVLVQAAALIGERGLSALMAAASAFGAMAFVAWRRGEPWRRPLAGAGVIALGLLGYGVVALAGADDDAPRARVALIHAGVEPRERWDPKNWPTILGVLKHETMQAENA